MPPNPDAPKLRAKTETRIALADEKSAQAYDELEAAKEKIAQLANLIDSGEVKVQLEIGETAVHALKKI